MSFFLGGAKDLSSGSWIHLVLEVKVGGRVGEHSGFLEGVCSLVTNFGVFLFFICKFYSVFFLIS